MSDDLSKTTIIIHEIATDGLPDMSKLIGRVAFIFDGCVASGWPLLSTEHPELYSGRNTSEVLWEADSDIGHGKPFAGITHWIEFRDPVWELKDHAHAR